MSPGRRPPVQPYRNLNKTWTRCSLVRSNGRKWSENETERERERERPISPEGIQCSQIGI